MSSTNNTDIARLIQERESATLDFKQQGEPQADIAELIAAFANAAGGLILFGAAQDARTRDVLLVGVSADERRSLCERIARAAHHSIEPSIQVEISEVRYENLLFVLCRVAAGENAVYQVGGRTLQRQHDQNVVLSTTAIQNLAVVRRLFDFEQQPCIAATLDDLDLTAVQNHLALLESRRQHTTTTAQVPQDPYSFLKARGCIQVQQDGNLVPTNAGILYFGSHPDQFFDHAGIAVTQFYGTTTNQSYRNRWDLADQPLPDLITRAVDILWQHSAHAGIVPGSHPQLPERTDEDRAARHDQAEYPLAVLRELTANAVAHRTYDNRGSRIRINLFDDRLEIISPGGLAGSITLANILNEQHSRNPRLARLLYERGLIEEAGTGLDNVVFWLCDAGHPPMMIRATPASLTVILPSPFGNPSAYPPAQPNIVIIQALAPTAVTALPTLNAPTPAIAPGPGGRQQEQYMAHQAILGYIAEHGGAHLEELSQLLPSRALRTTQNDIATLISKHQLVMIYNGRRAFYTLPPTEPRHENLNLRQQTALAYVERHGSITNAIYRGLDIGVAGDPGAARRTASNDLAELVRMGYLIIEGSGRSIRYIPSAPTP